MFESFMQFCTTAQSPSTMTYDTAVVASKPYYGQRPGTSGLRKPTRVFMEGSYTHNFVQCILKCAQAHHANNQDLTLVLGGDGRYFCRQAIDIIIPMCAANNVSKLYVGHNGIMSTPAISHVIRKYGASGGIVLTASHNPGGIDHDFGIKYNISSGGPAPEAITEEIYKYTQSLDCFSTVKGLTADIKVVGETKFELSNGESFTVSVLDSVKDYMEYMSEIFDFPLIRSMLTGSDGHAPFSVLADSMHGVMGPYVRAILCNELGLPVDNAINSTPLEDFGGAHPDPNLTYARSLVERLKHSEYDMGVAFDGDGDRNMILGRQAFFVSPCDSVAILADNLMTIPYFQKRGIFGFARSMPTSGALDRVAQKNGIPIYETPTGWKFFGNLMDADKISLCGEESFGTGSNHIREKDGLWTVLCWLSILANERRNNGPKLANIENLVQNHWRKYGRNLFTRHDYENCTIEQGSAVMKNLEDLVKNFEGPLTYDVEGKKLQVLLIDNFSYTDPIDKSVSKGQGIRVLFQDGSRLVFRLSGTGSTGATIRVYIDTYERDIERIMADSQEVLKPMLQVAEVLSKLSEITGRRKPDVIT